MSTSWSPFQCVLLSYLTRAEEKKKKSSRGAQVVCNEVLGRDGYFIRFWRQYKRFLLRKSNMLLTRKEDEIILPRVTFEVVLRC